MFRRQALGAGVGGGFLFETVNLERLCVAVFHLLIAVLERDGVGVGPGKEAGSEAEAPIEVADEAKSTDMMKREAGNR